MLNHAWDDIEELNRVYVEWDFGQQLGHLKDGTTNTEAVTEGIFVVG